MTTSIESSPYPLNTIPLVGCHYCNAYRSHITLLKTRHRHFRLCHSIDIFLEIVNATGFEPVYVGFLSGITYLITPAITTLALASVLAFYRIELYIEFGE